MLWFFNSIHRNSVTESTHAEYIRMCNIIINNEYYDIGNIQLGSFSIENNYILKYIEAITPHYSMNYIENQITKMKMVIKYAEKHDHIVHGLIPDIKNPNKDRVGVQAKRMPFLPKDTVDKMYDVIDEKYHNGSKKYGFYYWIMLLIIHTGIRSEEARAIRLNDINFDKKELTIDEAIVRIQDADTGKYEFQSKITKNTDSERVIPLNNVALDMLHRLIDYSKPKKDTDLICISKNGKYIINDIICKSTDRILRDVNSQIDHCSPHMLRHTFGSLLYEQGVQLKTISDLLGHKNISTTANIYIGLSDKHKEDSVAKLEPNK